MSSGDSTATGGSKKPNVPSPIEELDELFLLSDGHGMSTGVCSATRPASGAPGL